MSAYLQVRSILEDGSDYNIYEEGDVIRFNQILKLPESSIQFDPVAGVITFMETGIYMIDWSVIMHASSPADHPITLALHCSEKNRLIGESIKSQEVLSGSSMLTVDDAGVQVSLVNESKRILLGGSPVIACLEAYPADSGMVSEVIPFTEWSLIDSARYPMLADEGIRFNDCTLDDNSNVSYMPETGEFILSGPGTYLVGWWLLITGTDGIKDNETCLITLMVNGTPYPHITTVSPGADKTVCGTAFIRIDETPCAVKIANTTPGTTVYLYDGTLQASLLILQCS